MLVNRPWLQAVGTQRGIKRNTREMKDHISLWTPLKASDQSRAIGELKFKRNQNPVLFLLAIPFALDWVMGHHWVSMASRRWWTGALNRIWSYVTLFALCRVIRCTTPFQSFISLFMSLPVIPKVKALETWEHEVCRVKSWQVSGMETLMHSPSLCSLPSGQIDPKALIPWSNLVF